MLSVLIPTYNYNVYALVLALNEQCNKCGIKYEIRVIDDAGSLLFDENQAINNLENCTFSTNNRNIGRSKMRNLLAQKAKYDWLLFLDADTIPLHKNFIATYIEYVTSKFQIVYGGITYSSKLPSKNNTLRWFYGKKREAIEADKRNKNPYISFLTLNFLIPKVFFDTISFNEDIPNLRHEDTLFSFELAQKSVPILHINNPIIHLGLDTNEVFLEKTRASVVALKNLVDQRLIDVNYVRLSQMFCKIKKLRCTFLIASMFEKFKFKMEKHLYSANPSMLLFDLYRLGYYCTLEKRKNV